MRLFCHILLQRRGVSEAHHCLLDKRCNRFGQSKQSGAPGLAPGLAPLWTYLGKDLQTFSKPICSFRRYTSSALGGPLPIHSTNLKGFLRTNRGQGIHWRCAFFLPAVEVHSVQPGHLDAASGCAVPNPHGIKPNGLQSLKETRLFFMESNPADGLSASLEKDNERTQTNGLT